MSVTDSIKSAIPNRMALFPPTEKLPPGVRPIIAEYETVFARLDGLAQAWSKFTSEETIKVAREIDAGAQANAIRKGETASSVGSPATDDLKARTLAAEQELVGAITATNMVAEEVRDAMRLVQADEKASGRAAARAAADAYRKAAQNVPAARKAAADALTLPWFVDEVARRGPGGVPAAWQHNINRVQVGRYLTPGDVITDELIADLISKDAEFIANQVPLP